MNRDLSKIIVIDWDEHAYELQPRNALHRLKKWDGEDTDTDLVYLASFLKSSLTFGTRFFILVSRA
jgi:import inner membrane translocase subunit TIM50